MPVSLYITMEIVKICQVIFITWDLDMYHKETERGFQCKALNITEDLGQIEHIFTDKTGTLTENEMIFRCCTVAGNNYPHGIECEMITMICTVHCMLCLHFPVH